MADSRVQPAPPGAGGPSSDSRGARHQPIRWLLLALLIALGGFATAVPEQGCSSFMGLGDIGPAVMGAALACTLWITVITTVAYVIRRGRGQRRTWRHVLLSTSTLSLSLTFIVLGSVGLAAQRGSDCGYADPGAKTSSTSRTVDGTTMTAEQRAIVDYSNDFVRCTGDASSGRSRQRLFLSEIKKSQWTRAAVLARAQERMLHRYSACLRSIVPANDPKLADPARRSSIAMEQMATAWRDYRLGTERESIDLLDRGDKLAVRAQHRFRQAALDASALYRARGGKRLANHLDIERVLELKERASLG